MSDTISVALALFLIIDPLGNIPIFMSVLKHVPEERKRKIFFRELIISLGLMLLFLWTGSVLLDALRLSTQAIAIIGGIILLIVAFRMIFPSRGGAMGDEPFDEEPLIVPLATPLIARPSVLATLVLLSENNPKRTIDWTLALFIAWLAESTISRFSQTLFRILGVRGLKAIERLMGMLLISIAVQMFLNAFSSLI